MKEWEGQADAKRGEQAEDWFIKHAYSLADRHKIQTIIDRRTENREGDFEIIEENGNRLLIEIKSDHNGNYLRTGNLLIEIDNGTGKGWYQWAKHNGITHLVYVFYRTQKTQPYLAMWIDFDEVQGIIENRNYPQTKNKQCIIIPVVDIVKCSHTVCIAAREPKNTGIEQINQLFTRKGVRY